MSRQPPLTCPCCFLLFFFFLYLASSVSSSSSPSYNSSSSLSFSLPPLCSSRTEAHPKNPEKNPPEFYLLPPITILALASLT